MKKILPDDPYEWVFVVLICLAFVLVVFFTSLDIVKRVRLVPVIYYPKPYIQTVTEYKVSHHIELTEDMKTLRNYIKHTVPKMPIEIAERTAFDVVTQAKESGVSWRIVAAIIQCESFFYPSAISEAGAKGLMQVLRAHKVTIDQTRVYDIEYNIEMGIKILLLKLKKADGDFGAALHYYSGRAKEYEEKVLFENLGKLTVFEINQRGS